MRDFVARTPVPRSPRERTGILAHTITEVRGIHCFTMPGRISSIVVKNHCGGC
ncbi:MAG: hypothetical protein GF311_27375 [Candidatus Lokiarchaeota archaeon]|nr:hypothetical protein [Candidatus Lokiarchaeota archaeon]